MRAEFRSTFRNLLKASVACGVLSAAFLSQANAADRLAKSNSSSTDIKDVGELVVVGSRLAESTDGPEPVTILDRARIDALGATTVSDTLKVLPQQSFNPQFNSFIAGAQTVQLRGLSAGTTLILINGRRVAPTGNTFSFGVVDINSIPLAAVERIEILPDSASAIYGADAVGGVVNIVLKSQVDRPTLDLYYGDTKGGGREQRASATIGGGRGPVTGLVVLDYFNRDPLFGSDRDFTNNADYRRFGGIDRRVLQTDPGNVCAVSGNLPGLTSPCAAVPVGSAGVGLTPSSFLATAGQQNLGPANAGRAFVNPSRSYSILASGTWDTPGNAELFGELMYVDRTSSQISPFTPISNKIVSSGNPFNPFGVPVVVNFRPRYPGVAYGTTYLRDYREVLGAKGQFASWNWEVSFSGAQSSYHYTTVFVDGAKVSAALAATDPSGALNVFQDGPGGGDALLRSLLTGFTENNLSQSYQVSGFTRGDLLQIPAGPVQVAVGGEWRSERVAPSYLSNELSREAYAVYAEAKIPIINEAMSVPLVRDLSIKTAGRYDHYSDFGGTVNGQYGIEWRLVESLLIRGSYGDSFRAPYLWALGQPTSVYQNSLVEDPARNESVGVTYTIGGNPDLKPEVSTSSSFGLVFAPEAKWRPRLVLSRWRIHQESRLNSFGALVLLANEQYLPSGRVIRAPRTPADVAAGLPGRLLAVDTRNLNQGRLDTSGVDIEFTAALDTNFGRWAPRLAATYVDRYDAQDFPSTPVTNRVGVGNAGNQSGSIPQWKAIGSLQWSRDAFDVTGTARYVSSFADVTTTNIPNGSTIKAQTLFDLQAALNVGELVALRFPAADGLRLRVGAINLFDQGPRYVSFYTWGFDPSQGDLRGRFLYVGLSKAF